MPLNNQAGNNQHGGKKLYPDDWPEILQKLRRRDLDVLGIVKALDKEYKITIGKRTLERELAKHTTSTRKPKHTEEEAGTALIALVSEDPLSRMGSRALKERLSSQDVFVSRRFVLEFLKVMDYDAVQRRRPGARKVHRYGLHSLGPDEEWSLDGHDKLVRTMGIGIYGVVDKYSRMVLGHFAVRNNRLADTALACFLLVVHKMGGIPIQVTGDKGSETGKIHAVQTALRSCYAPNIDLDAVPAFVHLKSTHNITIERQWRGLFHRYLENVIFGWLDHKGAYHAEDELHQEVARFIWGKVVQNVLDQYEMDNKDHKIRRQDSTLLPSGGSPRQFHDNPEQWGGVHCLIPIPPEKTANFIEKYVPESMFLFCAPNVHNAATFALSELGSPHLRATNAWVVFTAALPIIMGVLAAED